MENQRSWYLIFACWIIAVISLGGSLFFSEIMEFPPCSMCWCQRIAMYPLALIFLAGLFPPDKSVLRFSVPLVVVGWLLAFWHNLLHWEIVPETATPCREGVSCSTVYLDWGIVTIPLMSLVAFTLIGYLLIIYNRSLQDKS